MKVSSKIVSGFLVLMLFTALLVGNHLTAVRHLQKVLTDISEHNLRSATLIQNIDKYVGLLVEDTKKYFVTLDERYVDDRGIEGFRADFHKSIMDLRETADSPQEQQELTRLSHALDEYETIFNRLKEQEQKFVADDLPPELDIALSEVGLRFKRMEEVVKDATKERVDAAAGFANTAERISWMTGILSLLLGSVVAGLIVRSINEPLRRLVKGTDAIAHGQFWHRLPVHRNDEFGELARDFNVMTERLSELDQMKKDFISHVSHELKAPLASIRQVMHLLLQEIPGPLGDQQKNLVQLSYNGAERLAAMVGNLLDVSRMEAGTMEYRMASHDIVTLIDGVRAEFDVQAQQKEIRLRTEAERQEVLVECDRDRIVQVVGNLYENALKFSPRGSEIVTRVGRGRESEVVISVSDSGPGVPDDNKQKIFEKFHQVQRNRKAAGQGVGLGLAICKTIVEAHHGQIWVEDNPGGGSVFSFVLPTAKRQEMLTCGQIA